MTAKLFHQQFLTRFHIVTIMLLSALMAGSAKADTDTTTFNVTATVVSSCSVEADDLAFGNYDPSAGNLDGSTTVRVYCSLGTGYTVGLDAGTGTPNATSRAMKKTDENVYLDYELYSDSSRSTVWENSTPNFISGTGTGVLLANVINHNVYARVPGDQDLATGSYADVITVTITF